MRRINTAADTPVNINDVNEHEPIFVKLNGRLVGMIVEESYGWILRYEATGHHKTREECLANLTHLGYSFYVDR